MACSFKAIASLTAFASCYLSLGTACAEGTLPASWLSTQLNETGQHCAPLAEQHQGDQLLLACGSAGVWEVSLASEKPRFVRSYTFSGDAVGFVSEPDGKLWVKLQVVEARPFPGDAAQNTGVFPVLPPSAAASVPRPIPPVLTPAANPAPAVGRPLGHVERGTPGEVVISLGSS